MVQVTDLPINGKIRDKFVSYLKEHPLQQIHLGDFGKWEGCGKCNVCGHNLIWSYRDAVFGKQIVDIGICCASNIIALKKCNGNFDELNFKRELALAKKTIAKNQKKWEIQQKAMQLEIKYNNEFKFCSELLNLAYNEPMFQELIGERDGFKFFLL